MKLIHLLILIVEILSTHSKIENSQKNTFISIYENLFLKYPKVDVKPEDFIQHLSPDSSFDFNSFNSCIWFISIYYTYLSNRKRSYRTLSFMAA